MAESVIVETEACKEQLRQKRKRTPFEIWKGKMCEPFPLPITGSHFLIPAKAKKEKIYFKRKIPLKWGRTRLQRDEDDGLW